jgi:hypothetical protein
MATEMQAQPRLIWGAGPIANLLRIKKQKAYYLLQRGLIPARKVGDEWVAEEGKLLAFLTDCSAAERSSSEAV